MTWSSWTSNSAYGHGWVEGPIWVHASIHLYRPKSHGSTRYFSRDTVTIPLNNPYRVVNYDPYNGTWHLTQVCLPRPEEDC